MSFYFYCLSRDCVASVPLPELHSSPSPPTHEPEEVRPWRGFLTVRSFFNRFSFFSTSISHSQSIAFLSHSIRLFMFSVHRQVAILKLSVGLMYVRGPQRVWKSSASTRSLDQFSCTPRRRVPNVAIAEFFGCAILLYLSSSASSLSTLPW
jgi:hypothetical protein